MRGYSSLVEEGALEMRYGLYSLRGFKSSSSRQITRREILCLVSLNAKVIAAIEAALSRGDRVEVIPGKNNSVKVVQTHRKVVCTTEK